VRLLENYYTLFAYKYVTQYDLNEGKSVLLIKTGRLEIYVTNVHACVSVLITSRPLKINVAPFYA